MFHFTFGPIVFRNVSIMFMIFFFQIVASFFFTIPQISIMVIISLIMVFSLIIMVLLLQNIIPILTFVGRVGAPYFVLQEWICSLSASASSFSYDQVPFEAMTFTSFGFEAMLCFLRISIYVIFLSMF